MIEAGLSTLLRSASYEVHAEEESEDEDDHTMPHAPCSMPSELSTEHLLNAPHRSERVLIEDEFE